jgi:hypothetical protein
MPRVRPDSPETIFTLIKGDEMGSETDYRDQLPINMTAVIKPLFGAAGYMIQSPGLTQYGSGSGVDRGGIWNERQSEHFRVSGTDLISVDSAGTKTVLGTISGSDTASVPYSFNTQGIVADGRFWLYDSVGGFREVTDPDLGDPIDCVWVDGYYFFTDGDFIYHTDITDEESIDPLKFATSEFSPDPSLGVGKTQDNKVIVFNRYTIEYFVNDASEDFSFARVQTRAAKIGIVGTHAKAEMGDKWYFLGSRKEEALSVHMLGVGQATKIASREVDKVIGTYTEDELKTAVVESREEDGQSHLLVHLPNHVLQYNDAIAKAMGPSMAWSILATGTDQSPWRGKHGVFEPRKGVWVYGDKLGSNLGIHDETVATQYESIAEWYLNTPFMYLEYQSIDKLEIETVPGFTSTEDATVAISLTYDGVTYGKEWFRLYGAPNDHNRRFIARRLGFVRDWVGIRLRGASKSRMAFSRGMIRHG